MQTEQSRGPLTRADLDYAACLDCGAALSDEEIGSGSHRCARAQYPAPCPRCHGTGGSEYNDCATCDGNGVV